MIGANGFCCNTLRRAVAEPVYPIRYDPEVREVHLDLRGDREHGITILRYCPFCGGQFPESLRHQRYRAPTAEDRREMLHVISRIRSRAEMEHVLGQPTNVSEGPTCVVDDDPWVRQYTYIHIWQSITLNISEYSDGSLRFSYSGKMADE